jgi:putative transcriptional regulator
MKGDIKMGKCLVSNTIRTERFMNGEMTQQQLADLVGVTRQTIVAIEKEKYSPSLELAFMISEVFGKELTEIFKYVGKEDVSNE